MTGVIPGLPTLTRDVDDSSGVTFRKLHFKPASKKQNGGHYHWVIDRVLFRC